MSMYSRRRHTLAAVILVIAGLPMMLCNTSAAANSGGAVIYDLGVGFLLITFGLMIGLFAEPLCRLLHVPND